jgi:hypothetical protein
MKLIHGILRPVQEGAGGGAVLNAADLFSCRATWDHGPVSAVSTYRQSLYCISTTAYNVNKTDAETCSTVII